MTSSTTSSAATLHKDKNKNKKEQEKEKAQRIAQIRQNWYIRLLIDEG
jgi:hypothetical protein